MKKYTKNRRKICAFLLCVIFAIFLGGCDDIEYTKTDREYYRTHTGTEDGGFNLPQWEAATEVSKEKIDTEEESEPGVITNCVLRTGVETDSYGDASANDPKAKIPANMEFDILGTDNGYFKVEHDKKNIWIPCKNCLINVKQFIPALEVDLGLSHSPNFFNIGSQDIKGLTEKQLYTRDGSVDGSEVWIRYEVALKLLEAEKLFEKDGYRIKITDAYRPNSVTLAIRDSLNDFLKTNEGQALKKEYFGSYNVGAFLAQKASAHNYGVAVDMTLVDKESGEEIAMPSAMHTLDASSAYSTWSVKSDEKTSHGEYMREQMTNCGFSTLESEWWHFQMDSVERVMFDIPN